MRLFPRRAGLVALAFGGLMMAAPSVAAQADGFNFHVLTNFGEISYLGGGAGTGSVPGVDVNGIWVGGEDMQGNTLTSLTVGGVPQFGYKQAGMRLTACVFNLGANSRLDFPAILTTEHGDTDIADGFNFNNPYNFLRPGCGAGTAGVVPAIGTAVFGAPTGAPPGASFQWIIFGLPTGLGIKTSAVLLSPNNGLIPSSTNSGTVAIVSALSLTAAISATGCFNLDLDWSAISAASAVPALDNVHGWWTQLTASRDNNQYWTFARDDLNLVKSPNGFTSGGATAVFVGLATSNLELHYFSLDPATHASLLPASFTGDNSYYAAGAPGPTGNVGYDLGKHVAISNSGITGANVIFDGSDPTGATVMFPAGVANAQDGSNAAVFIGPTPTMTNAPVNSLGFTTWNNNAYTTAGSNSQRVTWVQTDLDLLAAGAADPSLKGSLPQFFGQARVPVRIPVIAGGWPSALTIQFLPIFQHATVDQTGNTAFPDPSGNPAGTLGVAPIAGTSLHLPVSGGTGTCAFGGLPVGLEYGSSGLTGPSMGPLIWDSTQNRVSFGRSILVYD